MLIPFQNPRALPSAPVSTGLVQEVLISGSEGCLIFPFRRGEGASSSPWKSQQTPKKVLEEVTPQGGRWEGPGERGTAQFPKVNKKQRSSAWTGDPVQETGELAPPLAARPSTSSETVQGGLGQSAKPLTQDQERGLSETEDYGVGAHASKPPCCLDRTRDMTEGTTS